MQSTTAVFLWKKGRLNDIAEITMGQSPDGSSYNFHGEGIGLINGPTEFTNKYPVVRQWTTKPTKLCRPGDILLCVRGSSTGRMNLSDAEYCIGRGVASISAKEGKGVTGFLYYLLDYKISQLLKKTAGSTFPNLSSDEIRNMEISIPSLEEQNKIADILSTWDKAIELKEKLIEQKKEQKKGLMQRLLTGKVRLPGFKGEWVKVEFGKVMKFPKKKPVDKPEDYYLLTVKLHLKGIEATNKKPNVTSKGRPYFLREPGELLIGRQNFHNGGIGIVPEGMTGYVASNAISSIVAIKGNIKFYYYYMSNKNFFKRVEHLIGGTGQKEISESMLKKLKLVIPPTEKEQDAIVEVLTLLDKEIELLDNELSNLKQQKKGLMQLLLTGKVRVKC